MASSSTDTPTCGGFSCGMNSPTIPCGKITSSLTTTSMSRLRTTKSWNQLSQLFTQYGTQALNGQQSVETWLKNVQQQAGSS